MEIEERYILKESIKNLTPRQKQVIRLWLLGYGQWEIGLILGNTQQCVSYHKVRAISNLKSNL